MTILITLVVLKVIKMTTFYVVSNNRDVTVMTSQFYTDSKLHGTNMGPTWVLSAPDGPHVGPMGNYFSFSIYHIHWTYWGLDLLFLTWTIPAWICNQAPSKVWDEITLQLDPRHKFFGNLNQNTRILFQENALEIASNKMSAIFFYFVQ